MKIFGADTVYGFTLLVIFAICFLHPVQGEDESAEDINKDCENGVASSSNLLQTCEELVPPGEEPYCTTVSYRANPTQRRMKFSLVERFCSHSPKDDKAEECVNLPAITVFNETDFGDAQLSSNLMAQLKELEAPLKYCFCYSDGCNNEDGFAE